jgi:hypothetical protein
VDKPVDKQAACPVKKWAAKKKSIRRARDVRKSKKDYRSRKIKKGGLGRWK